ncbi:hypothetical protein HOM98_02560 [Candidatus Peregrinibacteria bacterium]|jgi:uncharacterized protein with PQ loop repeat|nr:hypothetical protein [Candidatus Peregrinibacteria bacterium]MBT7484211.1 hypothetical protein [Candidatus Peregrinibacteria bacterium]
MDEYSAGKHHQSIRKRIHQKHDLYPHPNKWKSLLDKVILFIGILGPIITLPQLSKIWLSQDAGGLSLITWTVWLFVDSIWILYGFAHKIWPIVFSHTAYFVIQTGVVIGILLYG